MEIVKRKRSEVKVQVGNRVAVSSAYFQDGCDLPEFYGTVKFVSIPLKRARVLWDVDNSSSDVNFGDLKVLDSDTPVQKPLSSESLVNLCETVEVSSGSSEGNVDELLEMVKPSRKKLRWKKFCDACKNAPNTTTTTVTNYKNTESSVDNSQNDSQKSKALKGEKIEGITNTLATSKRKSLGNDNNNYLSIGENVICLNDALDSLTTGKMKNWVGADV